MTESERFVEHLRRATEIVDSWPEWKKCVLGWPIEPREKFMHSKDRRAGQRHEVMQLLRFTSERLARSLFLRANSSTVRIAARKIEAAALAVALKSSSEADQKTSK